MAFSINDLVEVTREVEVTEGVVVGGTRDRVYGTAPSWTPGGNTLVSAINTGSGAVKSVRPGVRYADAEIPSELVHGLNFEELADVMRDTWPGSEAEALDVDATWNQAGTPIAGGTGPTITAAAGSFDNLLNAAGCMLETYESSGSGVDAANLRPRAILAVKSDGSQIDLEPLYTTGSAGQISEPLTNEGPLEADFKVGKVIRNQGVTNIRSVNFEFKFADQAGGSYQMVRGCKASGMKLSFDGQGIVTLSVSYMGMDYDEMAEASQGTDPPNDNPNLDNDSMTAGEDLTYFLVGAVNQLAGDNLTSFSLDGTGNASGIDNVSGRRSRAGVVTGDLDFTGSLKIMHEHTNMKLMTSLGRSGSRVPVDLHFSDPAGNGLWIRIPETLFEPGGAKPAGKGSVTDGTFNFKTQQGASGIRTVIMQSFAA